MLFLLAGPGLISPLMARTPTAPAPPPVVTLFAGEAACGQVLALAADDAGRIYAATTARAFGRGTVSPGLDPALQLEDQTLRSIAARERTVTGWMAAGKLAPLLQERSAFFQEEKDGPANFLTKYSESVRWLVDSDGDGKAETVEGVADTFRDPMDGPGSALVALSGGRWIYGCAPNLWRLNDRNEDHRAEERTPVAEGFGLKNAPWGADLHALLEAPDGWIYFGMGERGYETTTADGTRLRGMGSGAVFRCQADGSGLTRVASGLRNPTGLAMLPDGRLLAVDQAAPGGKTRLLQVIPGADFGWRMESSSAPGQGPWFAEGMETAAPGQAPDPARPQWMLPPLALWEGEASSLELLPDGTLLVADRQEGGKGGLFTWTLRPEGASFAVSEPQDLWRGGAVMALTQDPDGTVYFADWGDQVGALSQSTVRRFAWPAALPPAAAYPAPASGVITQRLPVMAVRELKGFLEHPSPRVALRARQRLEEMSFQDSMEALLQVARRSPSLSGRLHGLRGAAAVARQDQALLNELSAFLSDPEPAVRATVATLLGNGMPQEAPPGLRRALTDEVLAVRLAAAAAVAQLRPSGIAGDLLAAAAANPTRDPWLRSSLAHAMAEGVPTRTLAGLARNEPSPEARLTAVHALRRTAARELDGFLTDSDAVVATEASRAIYEVPVLAAFPALSAALASSDPLPEAFGVRALAAAWYLGTAADAARVAAFAQAAPTASTLRIMALDLLESWDRPQGPEPVWQRPTRPLPRLPGQAGSALRTAGEVLQQSGDPLVARHAAALMLRIGAARSTAQWLAILNDPHAGGPDRLVALQFLAQQQGNGLPSEALRALTQPAVPPLLRAEARALLMRREPKAAVPLAQETLNAGTTLEKQVALTTLDRLPGNGNDKFLLDLVRRLGSGLMERGIQVEVLEALQRRDIESRSPWRKATEAWAASLSTDLDPLAAWRMTGDEGDPAAGRVLFETHPEADCRSCHSLGGQGGLNGPDLDGVAERLTPRELLESLVQPSAKFAKGYQPPRPGVPQEEGEASAPLSPMPPAGTILTLRELRDLMAYLRTLQDS